MSRLSIRLLGPFQVTLDGEPVTGFRSDKARALLAYLAVEAEQSHRREKLAGLLWPDWPERSARDNLRRTLANVRSVIGDRDATPPFLLISRQTIQFNTASAAWVDVTAFSSPAGAKQTEQGAVRHWEQAINLYRGSFLEAFSICDSVAFEDWVLLKREQLHRLVLELLSRLTDYYAGCCAYKRALPHAWRQVELDPWRETAQRQLMRLLALSGQPGAALAQYETCRRLLAEELDVEPVEETTRLYERIRVAAASRPHNLPPQPTPFIGREEELVAVRQRLTNPTCRLLTIVGVGGIGKSRLALQVAQGVAEENIPSFLHGVVFVSLTGVESADSLTSTIANALGYSFRGQDSPDKQLLNYLRGKELLLLLDNYEYLLPETGLLVAMLRQASEIKLLVTSRERLNLHEEWVFELEGLSYPTHSQTPGKEDLRAFEAVHLFETSALRVQQHFSLDAAAPDVVRICQLVQGMPLALELSAGWLNALSCSEVARRIENDLDILATTQCNVPARHRSISAVFESFWASLTSVEQELLARLSVFRGGFTWEAAREVAGAALAVLDALVRKSLLRLTPSARYEIHELIRQYAAVKLADVPATCTATYERYCDFYASLLKRSEPALPGTDPRPTLTLVATEIENIHQAWHWALAQSRPEPIGRLIRSLALFYRHRGPFQEGERIFRLAVDRLRPLCEMDAAPTPEVLLVLGQLLIEWTRFLNEKLLYDQSISAARDAIRLARRCGSVSLAASGYLCWGLALLRLRKYDAAQAKLERVLALAPTEQIHSQRARSLRNLGVIAYRLGDLGAARAYFEQALRIFREIHDRRGEGGTVNNLALVFLDQDSYAQARTYFGQALEIYCEIGDRWGEGLTLINLGNTTHRYGDYAIARGFYEQALPLKLEIGDQQGRGIALVSLSLTHHHLREDSTALDCAQETLLVAEDLGDRHVKAYALTFMGHALLALGRTTDAIIAYRQALDLRHDLGQKNLALEPLAGLARAFLVLGDLDQAQNQVEGILRVLSRVGPEGTEEPFRVFLTCYQVLQANQDSRAEEVLDMANQLLRERAARIDDRELRRSFLENVAAHREILAAREAGLSYGR